MKEIVFISGKGGTGKTSLVASIAALASQQGTAVFADCDVDASDLHLVFAPEVRETTEFVSGNIAVMNESVLQSDYDAPAISTLCRFGAMHSFESDAGFLRLAYDSGFCEGCGVCVRFAPKGLFHFKERHCGSWFISASRFGPLVHAELAPRAENSGKLVTTVRKEAKRLAEEYSADWIICDGSPGTGCPVIASITGADAVVAVTEPTLSGQHDLVRVASLARHFGESLFVCVNKADINEEIALETETWCERNGIPFLGRIPYDPAVTAAQIQGLSLVEYAQTSEGELTHEGARNTAARMTEIWEKICQLIR